MDRQFRISYHGYRTTFLGIIAIGVSKTNGVFEISSRISKIYGYLFTIGLYLVIGPFLRCQDLRRRHLK